MPSMLKTLADRKEKFDIISLDPPTLIKKKTDIYRGRDFSWTYVIILLNFLNENGILGVITCAYHISLQDLIEVSRIAASKNGN